MLVGPLWVNQESQSGVSAGIFPGRSKKELYIIYVCKANIYFELTNIRQKKFQIQGEQGTPMVTVKFTLLETNIRNTAIAGKEKDNAKKEIFMRVM